MRKKGPTPTLSRPCPLLTTLLILLHAVSYVPSPGPIRGTGHTDSFSCDRGVSSDVGLLMLMSGAISTAYNSLSGERLALAVHGHFLVSTWACSDQPTGNGTSSFPVCSLRSLFIYLPVLPFQQAGKKIFFLFRSGTPFPNRPLRINGVVTMVV